MRSGSQRAALRLKDAASVYEDEAELQNWSEMMQQMVATSVNADDGRLEHQEELSKRWRRTTRSKAVAEEDSRRQWW